MSNVDTESNRERPFTIEQLFADIIIHLEYADGKVPVADIDKFLERIREATDLYNFRLKTMAPVFALRHAIINLTTTHADTALYRRDTRAVP